jgi:hypothetical protein
MRRHLINTCGIDYWRLSDSGTVDWHSVAI